MLTIRFQRTGKRNRAEFRVVVAPKTAAAQKKFTEILGSYNPRTKELVIKDQERLTYWLSQKLEISASVQNLLITKKLMEGSKVKAFGIPKKEAPNPPAGGEAAPAPEAAPTESTPAEPVAEAPVVEEVATTEPTVSEEAPTA